MFLVVGLCSSTSILLIEHKWLQLTRSLPNLHFFTSWRLQFSNQLFLKGSMETKVGALSEEADSSVKVQLIYLLEYVMFLTLATL